MTKDERFLIELYKKEGAKTPLDPLIIGKPLGYSEHVIKNILRGLMQANLIKKEGDLITLTPRGSELVKSLL